MILWEHLIRKPFRDIRGLQLRFSKLENSILSREGWAIFLVAKGQPHELG
jgi:hypothetical protein